MLSRAAGPGVTEVVTPVLMAFTDLSKKEQPKTVGPPLVLIPGLFDRKSQWKTIGKSIGSTVDSPVLAVDLRNHGASPFTPEFSFSHLSSDIEMFLKHVGAKDCHLLGHAFGGRVAMNFALENPTLVKSLIAVESSPFGTASGFWCFDKMLRKLRSTPVTKTGSLEEVKADMDTRLKIAFPNVLNRRLMLTKLVEKPDKSISWHFNLESIINNMDKICLFPSHSSPCPSPVLFLCGEACSFLSETYLGNLKTKFPKVVVVYAGGAGYRIYKDRPKLFSGIVADFINSNQSSQK